jgi:hypothetical protein
MAKSLLSFIICPNKSQRNTVAHRRAAVQRNLGVYYVGQQARVSL